MKLSKKILMVILTFCLLISNIVSVDASNNIKVKLDGKNISFDTEPCLIGGRTMVPLRAIFEALGATVDWDDETQTVTSYNEAYLVKCSIGKNEMSVNNQTKIMDIAPMIIDGRTLVPARFVAEAFACKVEWDAENSTVNITSSAIDYSKIEKPMNSSQNASNTYVSTTKEIDNDDSSASKGTLQKPYSAMDGAVITYQKWSHYPQKQISVKCTNIIRGLEANELAESENMFNDEPDFSQEWCFLEFDVKYISSTDNEEVLKGNDIIYDDTFFSSTGSKLNVADMATLGDVYEGYGVFDTEFYPGGSGKVVIGLLINKDIDDILLRVPNKSNNTNTWIDCTSGVSNSSSKITTPQKTSNSGEFYPGTSIPTYTSVTDVALKSKETLDSGAPVYRYKYTKSEDVGLYWNKLSDDGWTMTRGNDESTPDTFESSFVKGSQALIINVYFDIVEVWITYIK